MSYGGDVNRGPFLNTITWVFNIIALIFVSLRLISRRMGEGSRWQIDELFVILAMAVNLARAIYVSVTISHGFGQHLLPLIEKNPIAATALLRLMVIMQAIGLWTFTLPKLPIVAVLVRLFGTSRRFAIVLCLMALALVLLVSVMTITTFVQCNPVAGNWDLSIKATCWDKNVNLDLGYLAGAYSAFLDFAFALYPVLRVSNLQMTRSRKIIVAGSLSIGFVASIVTIYKLSIISEILGKEDPTWATIPLEVWNGVEGTTLLMAASIPLTRPIMLRISQGLSELTSRVTSIIPWNSQSGGSSARRSTKDYLKQGGDGDEGAAKSSTFGHSNSSGRVTAHGQNSSSGEDILLETRSHAFAGESMTDGGIEPALKDRVIYRTVDVMVE